MAEWINVKDKMPEDGKEVLFSDSSSIMVGWYNADKEYWELTDADMIAYAQDVTHWMPLPELPKMDEEGENGRG